MKNPCSIPVRICLTASVLGAALVLGCGSDEGGGSDGATPGGVRRWDTLTAQKGMIVGRLQDQDTGAAIAGATMLIGEGAAAQRVLTRQDGSFAAMAGAGRVRLGVESATHVAVARDVVVGEVSVERTVRVAPKGARHDVSAAGAGFEAGAGRVEVQAGTFEAAVVAATYFDKLRTAALPVVAQFVDDSGGPIRIRAALDLDVSVPFTKLIGLRLPVPLEVSYDAVTIFRATPAGWVQAGVAATVTDGSAQFAVGQAGTWAFGVDARKSEGSQAGYVVLDQGDGASATAGDFLPSGTIGSMVAAMSVADPWGSLVTTARGARVMLQPPAAASDTPDAGGAANRLLPYAGRLTAVAGTTEVVVAKAGGAVAAGARMAVETPVGTFVTAGAAFSVTVCEQQGKPVVRLDVADGTVLRAEDQGAAIEAGHAAFFCAGCSDGAPPVCLPPGRDGGTDGGGNPDAGVSPDAAGDAPVADAGPGDPACTANLLVNGGFEMPAIGANRDEYSVSPTFLPGWTLSAGGNQFFIENGMPFGIPRYHEGSQAVCLNADGAPNVFITQAFATVVGQRYLLRFAMTDEQVAGPSPSAVLAQVGDASRTFTRAADTGYVVKTLVFTATSTMTTLKLTDVTPGSAGGSNPIIDEVSVSCADDTDGGVAPTADAAPVPGNAGYALAFEAPYSQHVAIPDTAKIDLTRAFTYELWLKMGSTPGIAALIAKPFAGGQGDSTAIWFQSGVIYAGVNVTSASGVLSLPWPPALNEGWHHLAWTYDDATKMEALYLDGSQVASGTSPRGTPVYDGHPLLVGADLEGEQLTYGFDGAIDDVRIFASVRTVAELAADRAGASPDADPALVLHLGFDEGGGTTAHDSSPNHLDGSLGAAVGAAVGAPTWTVSTAPF